MMAVNLGTRAHAARNLVNTAIFLPALTDDLRIQNGYKEPHNVRLWNLGNEWMALAIGQTSQQEYGRLASWNRHSK